MLLDGMSITLIVIGVLLVLVLLAGVKTVPQGYNYTVERFGPVRSVRADRKSGLVLEVAFEGLARSTRHKSGVAMRFPRISRLRWDKPSAEADRIETLRALLDDAAIR